MLPSHFLRCASAGTTLAVRAQPGARKTAITGIYGEGATAQLKIAVHAPPVEGRANEALIAFLADTFSLPKKLRRVDFWPARAQQSLPAARGHDGSGATGARHIPP